jgi:hypothetical protein
LGPAAPEREPVPAQGIRAQNRTGTGELEWVGVVKVGPF